MTCRLENESTPAYLGRVLADELGLPAMAQRARDGAFVSRLVYIAGSPIVIGDGLPRLQRELAGKARVLHKTHRPRIHALMAAVAAGEFDGTAEEHEAWASTDDGQDVIADVLNGRIRAAQ